MPHVTRDTMQARAVSGTLLDTCPAPIVMVRARVTRSSPRLNVATPDTRGDLATCPPRDLECAPREPVSPYSLGQLKCFEMRLRRRVSEAYGGRAGVRARCRSVQTLAPGDQQLPRPRPRSLQLEGGAGAGRVVPCTRVRVRSCDEPHEEFRRAGIGACFRGEILH